MNIALISSKKTSPPILLLAASILFCLAQPALPQAPTTVTITIDSEGNNQALTWNLPIIVQIPVSTQAMTYGEWLDSGGSAETGFPQWSATVASDASFYSAYSVSGFPVYQGCPCYCPDLFDAVSRDSSFVAVAPVATGVAPLVWISACGMGQCTSGGALDINYWQIRYFSGNPAQGVAPTLQIGQIPDDGQFILKSTFTDFTVQGVPGSTEIVPSSLKWDPILGGLDFSYSVAGAPTAIDTTAQLFWANGPGLAGRIPAAAVYTNDIPAGTFGNSPVVHIPGGILTNAPSGTTSLLLVFDPDNLIGSLNPGNSLIGVPDVALGFSNPARDSARVSVASMSILQNLLRYAGQSSATITSVARTPQQQAQVMFNNAYRDKSANYAAPGRAVLNVYTNDTKGLTQPQILANETMIVADMLAKILQVGPATVSHHCCDPTMLNVVDISQGNFTLAGQVLFATAALNNPAVSKFLGPFSLFGINVSYDPCFHIEIPQTQPQILSLQVKPRAPRAKPPPTSNNPKDIGQLLALTNGYSIASGSVSTGTNEFTFNASVGDTITLGVEVTGYSQGSVYDDDDSMIFLLDSANRLVAWNDDDLDGGFQSVISGLVITNAGSYAAVVTTFSNAPLVNAQGVVTGWPNNGESDIQYSLFVYVTPASTNGNAPKLAGILNQVVDELTPLTVTASATDSNAPAETLTFSLDAAPSGMMINPNSGQINWTPTQTQSPSSNTVVVRATVSGPPPFGATSSSTPDVSVTTSFAAVVQEVNMAPVLPVVSNQVVNEFTQLTVTNTATESNIHSTLSYRLLNAPAGATINANGIINWIPIVTQSLSTNVITTVATSSNRYDLVNPSLSSTNSFIVVVVVQQPNVAPVLPIIANQTVGELTQLTVTDTATESNTNSTVSYSLLNPPAGATISSTGIITWTPSQAQSPSTTLFTAVATSTDPYDLLNPKLSATNGFYVVVQEVNVTPVFPLIAGQTVNALTEMTMINTATEPNIHDTLSYRLVSPPTGAAIDGHGIITWIPTLAQVAATNVITTIVTAGNPYDTVNPELNATNSFIVVVTAPQNAYMWTNILGGDWRVPANWSPNGVPGQADSAYIPNLGSGPTVMIYVNTVVGGLTFGGNSGSSSPTLAGPAMLTVTGPMSWSGGTIQNVVQCEGGALSGACYLDGGHLINTGTLAWDDATLNDGGNSVISNAPGATLNLTANGQATYPYFDGGAGAMFYNAGQMKVTNLVTIADTFVNSGNVSIDSGSLNLQGGGTNESIIAASSNATLQISANSASFTCISGSLLTNQGNILFGGYATINLAGTVSVAGTNFFGAEGENPTLNVTGSYPVTTPMVVSGGVVNFSGAGALTPPTLTMSGGTLTNSTPLVTGQLNWSGGTIEGVVQCNGGTASGEQVLLQGGQLINTGTLAWNVFRVVDENGSMISNAPGAVLNITGNPAYGAEAGTDNITDDCTFYNAGALNVFAGNGQFSVLDTFINTGVVSVGSGTLIFQEGGTNYSTIAVTSPDATLEFSPNLGSFTCTSNSELDVAGDLVFSGDTTVNLAGTVNVAGTNVFGGGGGVPKVNVTGYYPITTLLVISNGIINLNGTGPLTPPMMVMNGGELSNTIPIVTGQLNWNEGMIEGPVQFNGGTLGSGPAPYLQLEGGQLINTGTLTWNYSVEDGAGSVISNAPGGIINMGANPKYSAALGGTYDTVWNALLGQQPATFYNAGQLNIAAGTNRITIDDTLINTGTVSLISGTLNLANGGTNESSVDVAPAATLQLSIYPVYTGPFNVVCTYPFFAFNAGSFLNDAGNLMIGGPAIPSLPIPYGCGAYGVNLAGTVSVAGSNIFGLGESYPTTVNISGNYSTTNPLIFSGAVIASFTGAGMPQFPSMTMSGGTLSNTVPLVINGPLNWSGGIITGSVQFNGGILSNTCNLQGGQLINTGTLAWNNATIYDGGGSAIINSPGATINLTAKGSLITFPNSGGAGTFDNSGQLNLSAGSSPATIGDTFNNSGTVSVNSGTLLFSAGYTQTAGLTLLNGGNINNSVPLQIQGGALGGTGSISGNVTNSGVLSPGSPLGQMSIGGSYFQTPTGTLNIELAGTVPGVGFDLLTVTGAAALAGTLNAVLTNNYFPANTNTLFTFLQANPISGAFGNFSYPFNRVGMQVNYATNSSSIRVTSLVPVVQPVKITAPEYANGQFTMVIGVANGPYYAIEASTDLIHWDVIMTNASPNTPYQFTNSGAGSFPARFYRVQEPP